MCPISDTKQELKLEPFSHKSELAQQNREKKRMWGCILLTFEAFRSQASHNSTEGRYNIQEPRVKEREPPKNLLALREG